jgi:predicted transcriptional regulator of viral defense system
MATSRRDAEVIATIKEKDLIVFSPDEVARYLDLSIPNAYKIVRRLFSKGLIQRIEKGKYILAEKMVDLDVYEIATYILIPSYLGFWSALHFHHMTDQVPRTVFLATTLRKKGFELQGNRLVFVTIKPELFFGYSRVGRTLVSDREKTLIDCIRHPELSGGIAHIYDSIPEDIDAEKIVEYCEIAGSSSIASRLGYLLEKKGIDFNKERVRSLIRNPTSLVPTKKSTGWEKEWNLYVNEVLP